MEDPNIIELILNESVGKLKNYPPEDVECIPLLICKMFPFVKGMQRSLRFFMRRERESGGKNLHISSISRFSLPWIRINSIFRFDFSGSCSKNSTIDFDCHEEMLWREADREQRMFFFLPTLDEVISYGDKCDERFPKCEY